MNKYHKILFSASIYKLEFASRQNKFEIGKFGILGYRGNFREKDHSLLFKVFSGKKYFCENPLALHQKEL